MLKCNHELPNTRHAAQRPCPFPVGATKAIHDQTQAMTTSQKTWKDTPTFFNWAPFFALSRNELHGVVYLEITHQLKWTDGHGGEGLSTIRRGAVLGWIGENQARDLSLIVEAVIAERVTERQPGPPQSTSAATFTERLDDGSLAIQGHAYTHVDSSQAEAAERMAKMDFLPEILSRLQSSGLPCRGAYPLGVYEKNTPFSRPEILSAIERAWIDLSTPLKPPGPPRKLL